MTKTFSPTFMGAIFSLGAFFLWSCSDALTKITGLDGISIFTLICLPAWFGNILFLAYLALKKQTHKIKPQRPKSLSLYCLFLITGGFIGAYAFINLPMTTVYITLFMAPFLVSLIANFFMNEPLSKPKLIAILLGFIGVVTALFPEIMSGDTGPGNPVIGYICLPFFLLFYLGQILWLRIYGKKESDEAIVFFNNFFRMILLLPFVFMTDLSALPLKGFLGLVALGICGAGAYLFAARAYKLAPMNVVASFHYIQLVTGILFGYFFWNMLPTFWTWIGSILIVSSGLMILWLAKKEDQEAVEIALTLSEKVEKQGV